MHNSLVCNSIKGNTKERNEIPSESRVAPVSAILLRPLLPALPLLLLLPVLPLPVLPLPVLPLPVLPLPVLSLLLRPLRPALPLLLLLPVLPPLLLLLLPPCNWGVKSSAHAQLDMLGSLLCTLPSFKCFPHLL
jgi:hypothetical protein